MNDSNRARPQAGGIRHAIGKLYLKLMGWRCEGELPSVPKAVLIAAPHTSNWDLPHMLAIAWVFRLRLSWLGKHTIFGGPQATFMRWLGGIPVDRRSSNGVVAQVVERFAESDSLMLAIAPSGTRSAVSSWKSGFYHIAHGAKVPVLCGFLDYGRKVGGVGPALHLSGNIGEDMDRIRAFYEGMEGRHPAINDTMELREENERPPKPIPIKPAVARPLRPQASPSSPA